MKKLFFVLGIAMLGVCLQSCKKEGKNLKDQTADLDAATMQAIKSGSTSAVRQAYSLLSNEEKQILWETKLNAILSNDRDRLTVDQRSIILSVKDLLEKTTVAGLIKDSKAGDAFVKANLAYFQKHFTVHQLYALLETSYFCDQFSILKAQEYIEGIDNGPGKAFRVKTLVVNPPDCTCYYSVYCARDPQYHICDESIKCTQVTGCGVFGGSNCVGKCS